MEHSHAYGIVGKHGYITWLLSIYVSLRYFLNFAASRNVGMFQKGTRGMIIMSNTIGDLGPSKNYVCSKIGIFEPTKPPQTHYYMIEVP